MASASWQSFTVLSGIDLPVLAIIAGAGGRLRLKRNFSPVLVASILRSTSSAGAMTSGPMPSPPITAMWKLSLASIR